MQHLDQPYADIMRMPTYQRRYFLGLLTKKHEQTEAELEKRKETSKTKNGKGNRTTRVSGDALKSKLKSGDIK